MQRPPAPLYERSTQKILTFFQKSIIVSLPESCK